MNKQIFRSLFPVLAALALGVSSASGAATIVIQNNDGAGVGFNDTTAVSPVGGNTGTTLGEQRMIAFQFAASKWGATLDSPVTITIRAQWVALTCTANSAVLASAGANILHVDFPGAPFPGTLYNESLAGKYSGVDPGPGVHEINVNANVNLGQAGCFTGTFFYLGLDNNHGANVDLVATLLHEFGHGLGFQNFTNGATGARLAGFASIYDRFLVDDTTGESWFNMTNAERAASAIKARQLAWNGPQVEEDVPSVLVFGVPVVRINSPAIIAGDYDATTVAFGPPPSAAGATANIVQAQDPADGAGPSTTDGCSAFTNAAAIAGNIAIVDRGTCTAKTKTLNAQNAGAIGVIVVNNVAGSPAPSFGDDGTIMTPITIPTVVVTQPDGNTIKAQLGGTVNGSILLDMNKRAGADSFGKMLLFSPNPFSGGSSVSHWDTIASPNQLMEPSISSDLTHEVTTPEDLTFSQMSDIGWVPRTLPQTISKTTGDNQSAVVNGPFVLPFSVMVTPPVSGMTVTWTVNPNSGGAGATFSSTGTRFATSTTDALGVAVAPPTLNANGVPGFHSMNATVPGAGTTTFILQNAGTPVAGSACTTDTTQADFQGGVTNATDVNTNPDNVTLLNAANPDQQNQTLSTSGNGITTTSWSGQTFIPAVTGQLAKVDINVFCAGCTGTTPTVTVSLRNTAAGLPTGADLAAVTMATTTSGAGGYFTFNFPTPPTVTAGTQYALVIRNATNPSVGTNAITRSATDVYASGARVTSPDSGATWTAQTTDIGFITYIQTGFAAAGDFVSSVKDSNPPVPGTTVWSTMSWTASVPANTTLRFQAAGSNSFGGPFTFVGPDGTPASFYTTSPANISQFSGNRYLKYKAYFTTTDPTMTPILSDVSVCSTVPAGISINDVAVAEGNTGSSNADFTVSLSGMSPGTVTVNYATGNGSATTPFDYTAVSGTLTFAPGETSKTISVPINGDTEVEADETFVVNLSNANNGAISDNQGEGTITNDDVAPTPTPTPTATPSPTATPTPTPTPSPTPASQAVNLSTRMHVAPGDNNAGIGGFIITGSAPKHVIIRAIGPSLTKFGFEASEVLADPTLEVHGPASFGTITNNNWRDSQEAQIKADGLPPTHDLEAAIDATLPPGAYTAIVRGNGAGTGIALVEVYDLDTGAASKLANLSTRARVGTGGNIVIAGFVLGNNEGDDRVVIRGLGPSLSSFGVTNTLQDPTLELRDQNGVLLVANNDWQDDSSQAAEITAAMLEPTNPSESAIAATLPPGLYTALLSGRNDTQGVGIVEVYDRGP